jgi:hypothetical protein
MISDEVARCFEPRAQVVTAYLETPSDDPQAASSATRRWKVLRRRLEDDGADEETLRAMDGAVGIDTEAVERGPSGAAENRPDAAPLDDLAEHGSGAVQAIVASGGEVLLHRALGPTPAGGRGRVGPLPWLGPVLVAEQGSLPALVVLVDRRGADLWGVVGDGGAPVLSGEVEGSRPDVERVQPGGWSQRRFQQRAVEAWTANAREVAIEVAELARSWRARLVLVAGDVHATAALLDAIPPDVEPLVRRLASGARGPESGLDGVADEVGRLVRSTVAAETTRLLERFREEVGQRDRGADGPADVVRVLQMALVDTLLVHDDVDDDRLAWFGPQPLELALERGDLEAMGVEDIRRGRLVDVALRAAIGGGSDVRMVPRHVTSEGLGALLRAPDPS